MIFINPWASYHSDDIPDLTPDSDEELVDFLCAICGYIISTIIYVILFYLCFVHAKGVLRCVLILIDSVVIYPILMICLVKLSFKIGEKIYKMKK
jgi:hypothetical protein